MYSEIAFFVNDICDATLESEGINNALKIIMHICFLKTLPQYTLKKVLNWHLWFHAEPLKSLKVS